MPKAPITNVIFGTMSSASAGTEPGFMTLRPQHRLRIWLGVNLMKTILAWHIAAVLAYVGLGLAAPALAQDKIVKIGVLNDRSGLYSDVSGPNSVVAVKMAVEDSRLVAKGWRIDVLSADHQNKPDVGVNITRSWIDNEKVDAVADTPNSGVALAVSNIVREKNAVLLNSGAASTAVTGKACSPNTVSFTYDTYMLATGAGKALIKAGGDTWFFLTADYAFGQQLESDTTAVVTANGGKVLNRVRHPLNTSDLSSFLLQAQASKAKVVGLANAGGDTTNAIKQHWNLASSRPARSSPDCCCSSTTCIRWG
jgi:branched-chain amino acid transport system substrate-binding protein